MRKTRIPGLLKEGFKEIYRAPAAGSTTTAGGLTTIDFSTPDHQFNTDRTASVTSLGTTSTLNCIGHGALDGGKDAYIAVKSIGEKPDDSFLLRVQLTMDQAVNTTNNNTYVSWVLLPTNIIASASLSSNYGYYGGYFIGSNDQNNLAGPRRVGGTLANGNVDLQGTLINENFIFFDADGSNLVDGTPAPTKVTAQASGSTLGLDPTAESDTNDSNGDFTGNIYLGISISIFEAGSTPVMTGSNIVLKYEWMGAEDD